MSFVKNDNQQLTVLDSTFNLTEREKRMLEKSWAKIFADKVFPAIDENIFFLVPLFEINLCLFKEVHELFRMIYKTIPKRVYRNTCIIDDNFVNLSCK